MNYRQLQYAVMLSKSGSFSAVAEKLNISQPALSKQILSLEKELEVQLFDRSQIPVTLTAAGEYFIREAKAIIYKENQLVKAMEQFRTGDKGQLIIGITPFRSAYLIPETVKKIRSRFPGIQIKLVEQSSEELREGAVEGRYDFALINLPVDEGILNVTPIEPDKLALVISDKLAKQYGLTGEIKEIDFSDCGSIPFVVAGEQREMRQLFDGLSASTGVCPPIAAEVINLTSAWEMARAGVGATLLPVQFVSNEATEEGLSVFRLKNPVCLRQPVVVTKKGQYISKYVRYAIELLTKKSD